MLSVLSIQICLVIYEWEVHRLLRYFTNWAMIMTYLNIALSLKCSLDTKIEQKKNWLAFHHLSFELSCPMNLVSTSIYWTLMHKDTIEDPEFASPVRQFLMYVNHLTPFICNWINFSITDVIVASKHWISVAIFGVIYSYINYRESMARGKPLYP